jgi:5-methylcytosine-specific restriction endonuclease McrA
MPYKDKQKQREYQKKWIRKRRYEFFSGKKCEKCGSKNRLELDHVNPSDKVDNRVWSWSEERRNEEIEKCQVLCYNCHLDKTRVYLRAIKLGSEPPNKRLSDKFASELRKEIQRSDKTLKQLSIKHNVPYHTVKDISSGRSYVNAD